MKIKLLYCDQYPNKLVYYGDKDVISLLSSFVNFLTEDSDFNSILSDFKKVNHASDLDSQKRS